MEKSWHSGAGLRRQSCYWVSQPALASLARPRCPHHAPVVLNSGGRFCDSLPLPGQACSGTAPSWGGEGRFSTHYPGEGELLSAPEAAKDPDTEAVKWSDSTTQWPGRQKASFPSTQEENSFWGAGNRGRAFCSAGRSHGQPPPTNQAGPHSPRLQSEPRASDLVMKGLPAPQVVRSWRHPCLHTPQAGALFPTQFPQASCTSPRVRMQTRAWPTSHAVHVRMNSLNPSKVVQLPSQWATNLTSASTLWLFYHTGKLNLRVKQEDNRSKETVMLEGICCHSRQLGRAGHCLLSRWAATSLLLPSVLTGSSLPVPPSDRLQENPREVLDSWLTTQPGILGKDGVRGIKHQGLSQPVAITGDPESLDEGSTDVVPAARLTSPSPAE